MENVPCSDLHSKIHEGVESDSEGKGAYSRYEESQNIADWGFGFMMVVEPVIELAPNLFYFGFEFSHNAVIIKYKTLFSTSFARKVESIEKYVVFAKDFTKY